MDDRKKLIDLIYSTPCEGPERIAGCCPARRDGKCGVPDRLDICVAGHIADNLLANGVTMQRWIPVTEEKPKRRGRYFIAYKFRGSDMQFYGEAMWHDDIPDNGYVKGDHFSNEGVEGMYVTHWMEIPRLPAPPKEAEPDA